MIATDGYVSFLCSFSWLFSIWSASHRTQETKEDMAWFQNTASILTTCHLLTTHGLQPSTQIPPKKLWNLEVTEQGVEMAWWHFQGRTALGSSTALEKIAPQNPSLPSNRRKNSTIGTTRPTWRLAQLSLKVAKLLFIYVKSQQMNFLKQRHTHQSTPKMFWGISWADQSLW